jgi:hypothetical protein
MGCEGNHQFYLCSSDFIIDNINFVYYKFTLIIGWNIANCIDNVTISY